MADIYGYERIYSSELKRLEKSKVLGINKKTILKFHDYQLRQSTKKSRVVKCMYLLRRLSLWLKKDFYKASKIDIENLVSIVVKENFAESSKVDYRKMIKQFWKKWLYPDDPIKAEELVGWIKCKNGNNGKKLPVFITEDEVKKLIGVADNIRDKALIAVLFDSGMRISELMSIQLKHVKFSDKCVRLIAPEGKTGARRVLLIPSVPYLANWVDNHPNKDDKEAFLWIGNKQVKPMRYQSISRILKDLGEKAGIPKDKISPHKFRHGSATYSANFLTESQMKERFGWTAGSDMAGVYVHLSGRDVDEAYMKKFGLTKGKKKEESGLKPKECFICQTVNGFDDRYCKKCGKPLDIKTAIEQEEKDKKADLEIRDLLNLALKHRELSFEEIMEKYKNL